MTKDVIPFMAAGGGLISREDLAKSLENAAMSMPAIGGDYQYLKMDREGVWLYGVDETEVEEDSLWAVNPLSLMHGWVAWDTNGGGAPVQEFMAPINRQLPPESSLPALGLGSPDKKGERKQLAYQQQRSVDLVCISGEDEGTVVQYKQSSGGAMKLFSKLTNGLFAQVQKDPANIVQVVKLKSESYKNKTYGGRTYNPIFELVEWRSIDDTSAPGAPDEQEEEPEQEQPAPRQRTRTAAPPQEPELETPEVDEEAAALAAEYEREKAQAEQAAPRRRVRR